MTTAILIGGPKDGKVITLANPGTRTLMILNRRPDPGTNIYRITRYDRTNDTVAGHTGFAHVESTEIHTEGDDQ